MAEMRYRRADAKGGTYFFTVNLAERQLRLLVDHVAVLRAAAKEGKRRHPFYIDAFVILPDHLHAMWTLPEGDDYVQHGRVSSAAQWPHSSIHRHIVEGALGCDWGGETNGRDESGYGER